MKKDRPNKSNNSIIDSHELDLVQADVTLRSASGKSIHEPGARIDSKTVREYLPPEGAVEQAVKILEKMGFRIIARGKITINVAAPVEKFQRIMGIELSVKRFFPYMTPPKQKVPDEKGCGLYFEFEGGKVLPTPKSLVELVETIHLATPAYFCQSPDPPSPAYFHLKVPNDVARLVDAIQCHNRGFSGTGVKLAMPDQGTFDHPYYTTRGYNITLDESAYDSTADDGSHGTAIAANALAVAPGVQFIGIRTGKKVSSATAAFQQSVEHNPDVISISWGTTSDVPDLRAAVALAIADGITICCACGNGGAVVFPSSMPELISVGGAYANETDGLQASTYASSGILAGVDPGRQMPDLTGLVGQAPNGVYITLPVHPNSGEDRAFAGGSFPNNDETAADDGWIVASGTSSAAPQVAGAACLLIQSNAAFRGNPAAIKQRLLETSLDVTSGVSASGENAAPGVDNATGHGIVDAYLALNRVDVWIRDNTHDRGLVPCKGAHWVSPDIKVLEAPMANPSTGFDAAVHINRPVYGTGYYVYIKARNRGVDPASNVSVSFYYADPSTFNVYPTDWRNGQSGVPAEGSITVGGVPTNLYTLGSIAAKSAGVAGPFLWHPPQPTSATQVVAGEDGRQRGHFCLLTRIDCAADPITWTGGSQPTVWQDNNIGMKNIWVVEPEMMFPLLIGHVPEAKSSKLIIATGKLPKSFQILLELPRDVIDHRRLDTKAITTRVIGRDRLHLLLHQLSHCELVLNNVKKTPVRVQVKSSRLRSYPSRLIAKQHPISVDFAHYADGILVGGASFRVKTK